MNTPRSKKPIRYSGPREVRDEIPEGTTAGGIYNEEIAAWLGKIIGNWPHTEEAMIEIFRRLIDWNADIPARQMFRSIVNQQARIKIMRTLLETTPQNKNKGPLWDEVIDEFDALNTIRNKYAHGLWYTHESGRVYFAEQSTEDELYLDKREVTKKELKQVNKRMGDLYRKVWLKAIRQGSLVVFAEQRDGES